MEICSCSFGVEGSKRRSSGRCSRFNIKVEHTYEGQKIKILFPTDCIVDRLASYMYAERGAHGERKTLEQAVMVAKAQPYNLGRIKKWCMKEGHPEVFEQFLTELKI